jgi:3-deoxy-D-manno-octulosonic-acid transferase
MAYPALYPWLAWKYREGLAERRGLYSAQVEQLGRAKPFWIHAVSVGEVQSALPFVSAMRNGGYGGPVLLSTITSTGKTMALQEMDSLVDAHVYYPWDVPRVVDRALDALSPRIYTVMETEIWPNLLLELEKRGVPAYMVNARFSEKSFRRAMNNKPFWSRILSTFRRIFARSGEDEARIREMGVDSSRLCRVGDSKVDALMERKKNIDCSKLAPVMGGKGPVFVAGSTHPGEEETVLEAFAVVRRALPESRLVLAPRHPERGGEVLSLAMQQGEGCLLSKWAPGWTILVVDRIGILFDFYGCSDAAFVGGSLVQKGGQNLLEPLAWGVPVFHGPHMEDFRDLAGLASRAGLARRIENAESLASAWIESVGPEFENTTFGQRCEAFLAGIGGASAKTWEEIASDNKKLLWE